MLDLKQYRKLSVPVLEALSAAIVAFRINEFEVKRYSYGVEYTDNKTLMINHFIGEPLDITEEDRKTALEMIAYLTQRRMMNVLIDARSSDFFNTVVDLLVNDTIKAKNFGVLAWAPKLYATLQKSDDSKSDVMAICASSKWVGQLDKPVTVKFQKLVERYNRDYDRWSYIGHDSSGNLISFWAKPKLNFDVITIKGRVKKQDRSKQYNNLPITHLNYVKEVEEKE